MPVVFLHGVTARPGRDWERACGERDRLLRRLTLPGLVDDPQAVHLQSPMWGDLASNPRWNHAALPDGAEKLTAESDSPEVGVDGLEALEALEDAAVRWPLDPGTGDVLLRIVREAASSPPDALDRQPLETAIDVFWSLAAGGAREEELDALADFAAAGIDYAQRNATPAWLGETEGDQELLDRLLDEIEASVPEGSASQYEELGERWQRLGEAADRLRRVNGRLAGRAFTTLARRRAQERAAMFLGDVLVYLNERGTREHPGAIVERVVAGLERAAAHRDHRRDPRLIVIAHSMGGNIAYDVLTHFRPDLEVEVLVTVGSQVAVLEELKQFRASRPDLPGTAGAQAPPPPGVGRWVNVFDVNDMLGFAAGGVFAGAEDFSYSTGMGALAAHGSYFRRPSFYARLGRRLRTAR